MFTRLARFRLFELPRVIPRGTKAAYSNDNLPGRRRPAGGRRSPPPALACHWHLNEGDGRLECHWEAADLEEESVGHLGYDLRVAQKYQAKPAIPHRSLVQAAHKQGIVGGGLVALLRTSPN
jgi:hypothetical protein